MTQLSNILVIAEAEPLPTALEDALTREQFSVRRIDLATAVACEELLDEADGVVVSARNINSQQWSELAHILDSLESRNVASLVMLPEEHQGKPVPATRSDGLVCMSATDSSEEIWGRLSTIAAHRAVIRELENELAGFYRRQPHLAQHLGELDEEMRMASRLQRDFLPKNIACVGDVSFEVFFQPCSWVSGDIYDVFRLDEENVGFYVADAVGHGMPAALLTIFIKRAIQTKRIRGNGYELISPEESLALLNQDLIDQNLAHCQFATICYCLLNTRTLRLDLARAGHPYPLLIKSDQRIIELGEAGSLLGVFPEEHFQPASYQLEGGDRLLVYSDGLEDAIFAPMLQNGTRPYRPEFTQAFELNLKTMLPTLANYLNTQLPPRRLRDDMTAVALQIQAK